MLISIVIPVYNNIQYLPKALESVMSQAVMNPDDIEIVIVDDGSTDGSGELADDLAKNDKRIRVFHQENQWVYASFNRGIREARGEYVFILNSDDRLEDGVIPLFISKIHAYDHPDVIWSKVIMCDVDLDQNILSRNCESDMVTEERYYDDINEIHRTWVYLQKTNLAQNQANLYKRKLMFRHPFRNDVYAGDLFFNLDIARDVRSMLIITEPVYDYFFYNIESRNISMYKYYDYEHEMFSELFDTAVKLYREWGIPEDQYLDYLVMKRLKQLSIETKALTFKACPMEFAEKMDVLFGKYADPQIRENAVRVGREREYESRILNGAATLLNLDESILGEEYKYVSILTRFLPEDYLQNVDAGHIDMQLIEKAINDKKNPDRIGKIYYSTDWEGNNIIR